MVLKKQIERRDKMGEDDRTFEESLIDTFITGAEARSEEEAIEHAFDIRDDD